MPLKCSFTLSKLRFFGLRTPKNDSFIQPYNKKWITHLLWIIHFILYTKDLLFLIILNQLQQTFDCLLLGDILLNTLLATIE